ncbi:MAG: iron-responsive transcriptional regulator RirA [Rhizobiaceae bacterium]|nr:iron-responsive transcriptional regulator RirA [Rhizobiaceae bacterium]
MRLTRQTNYAVRILMYCSANEGNLSRVPDIAEAYGLSEAYLFKILKPMMDAKIIESVRGRNGGIRLARDAADITLFDVVRVTEENFALAECFDDENSDCPLIDSCGFNSALREALNAFFEVLGKYTIADMVAARPNINFLLGLEEMEAVAPAA